MPCLTGEQTEQFLILTCSSILTRSGDRWLHCMDSDTLYFCLPEVGTWMHFRFWKDSLLLLPILALFKAATHCGAEQRVME